MDDVEKDEGIPIESDTDTEVTSVSGSQSTSSDQNSENSFEQLEIDMLHDRLEFLQKKTIEATKEKSEEKLKNLEAQKLPVLKWLLEIYNVGIYEFNFNTGDSELDMILERIVSQIFRDKNSPLEYAEIVRKIGADGYYKMQRLTDPDIIMKTIYDKLQTTFELFQEYRRLEEKRTEESVELEVLWESFTSDNSSVKEVKKKIVNTPLKVVKKNPPKEVEVVLLSSDTDDDDTFEIS